MTNTHLRIVTRHSPFNTLIRGVGTGFQIIVVRYRKSINLGLELPSGASQRVLAYY